MARPGDVMSWNSVPLAERNRVRAIVLARDRGICQLQIEGVCTHRATVADHITPREVGGDGPENLQAACAKCNGRKGDPRRRDPDVQTASWI